MKSACSELMAMASPHAMTLLYLYHVIESVTVVDAVTVSPPQMASVCRGHQLEILCTTPGNFLEWSFLLIPDGGTVARRYFRSLHSDLVPATSDLEVNSITFTFSRISAEGSLPVTSRLLINPVNDELNGTLVNCTDVITSETKSTSVLIINEEPVVRDNREDLIEVYFSCGYPYRLIVCFLHFVHGITLSLRQLKRILRRLNLRRRRTIDRSLIAQAITLIRAELRGSGSLLGYRSLWRRLHSHYGLYVPRDLVMRLLANISPENSYQRRNHCLTRRVYHNKGPNYVWHADGLDKLKPYGFAVHGCIDGYSRRVLWLHAGTSNNDPQIIAHHYLNYVKEVGGMPMILRSDCGTDNTNLSFIQPYLRRNHTDCFSDMGSFRYGKSTANQRIEAWWSQLSKKFTHWWCTLFKRMQEHGLYDNTNFIHVDCLRLCFMHLIQEELQRVMSEWNSHRIRPTRNTECPPGHPNELYFMPEILGVQDYLCPLDTRDLPTALQYAKPPDPPACLEFLEAAKCIMDENNLQLASDIESAMDMYVILTTTFEQHA